MKYKPEQCLLPRSSNQSRPVGILSTNVVWYLCRTYRAIVDGHTLESPTPVPCPPDSSDRSVIDCDITDGESEESRETIENIEKGRILLVSDEDAIGTSIEDQI